MFCFFFIDRPVTESLPVVVSVFVNTELGMRKNKLYVSSCSSCSLLFICNVSSFVDFSSGYLEMSGVAWG